MLTSKFRPQFNETIKSMQFRKLCRNDREITEELMGRLRVAAIECNYQEVDRQLKEQFIHGLNDKNMLEEIIKELTTVRGDEQMTSENFLAWAKRVEAERAQAAVLGTITKYKEFNKISVQTSTDKQPKNASTTRHSIMTSI